MCKAPICQVFALCFMSEFADLISAFYFPGGISNSAFFSRNYTLICTGAGLGHAVPDMCKGEMLFSNNKNKNLLRKTKMSYKKVQKRWNSTYQEVSGNWDTDEERLKEERLVGGRLFLFFF